MRLGVLTVSLSLLPASLAGQWPPDRLENLQVLPDTVPVRQLVNLMAGFTRALGVRCTYCHVGEEGQPLSAYDFPSDDKLTKRKAREMLRMVETINARLLTTVPERRDPPVDVQCATCHHGVAVPRPLQDVLLLAYDAGGVDSARGTYGSLRDEYYGAAAYDFGEVPLADVANVLHRRGTLADAVALHALNVEHHPASTFARMRHARAELELVFRETGPDAGTARYRELRTAYGAQALPEFALNELGYALLRAQHVPAAVRVFELTVEAFPESANAYDSLGEGYAAAGERTRAIESYEKSLALDPDNQNAVEKLRALRGR